ncbi:uncharacterized protein THITE_2106180 [Thermothielavioides terrestris NRRL 8126]|uniref:C2H2-type domain-containing protein n=1 Tax=Thermothielavioides terrestris (strain ATCC 38088 / NRRL 8126) TaxID=578455 RepID=G2QWM4_THETT|nr:uncharacterized protein THITE_2106180 [Thermothielavioides terrestris NRRL 8126]AEO62234.1 hypothetical protein THITE_2106180 [Thermothielavioides terrestris NRRL 8126]
MEPSSKRRRLAPKVPDLPPTPQAQAQLPPPHAFPPDQVPPQHYPHAEPAPRLPERDEFEAFARHLQDAAIHIQQQTLRPKHTSVSVLMLRWEEDTSVEQDLLALEKVFRERYHYHTVKWAIPTVPNPSTKLGIQIASFLDNARPDHLLIIYYAGHGYVGPDNQLYWACNPRENAAKLKWDGVRCLLEDAQSEILLLIDSCAVRDAPLAGSHGAKQAIAAYTPDQASLEPGPRSFTATLAETLQNLSAPCQPFSAQKLYDHLRQQKQQESAQAVGRLANGPAKPVAVAERSPAFFTLTPAKGHGIVLVPLDPKAAQLQSPPDSADDADAQNAWKLKPEDRPFSPEEVLDLVLDEQRVLVCTTFVGDASPDMAFFNQWLHNMPPTASKITVEGMFLGPPTMLLISMPLNVWNIVQHDKVCCFLGHISSHNMIHLYQRLVNTRGNGLPGAMKSTEDARAVNHSSSAVRGAETPGRYPPSLHKETPRPQGNHIAHAAAANVPAPLSQASPGKIPSVDPKDEAEDSVEMQEAAEQLKALSHVRHIGDSTPATLERQPTGVADSIAVRHAGDFGSPSDAALYDAEFSTPSAKPRARKPLQKHTPRQEVRCDHCSHAPFKDSSSLRKHIAAAHTRPFPCAFSFAGCTSTFGSKNEWKRHISSQHLCLQYYRCSSCPQSAADGKGNEFNRKDLFTQHLRRMHAPFAIKKATAKGDSKLQAEWDAHVKDMQTSCLVTRRQPPQRSACPKPDCQSVFEGPGSWDEWTEHVGRHMEKGEAGRMGVDPLLAEWALDEGIVEKVGEGEYRLCPGNGPGGSERESNGLSKALSDGGKKPEEDDDPSITVAMPTPVADNMDVD